MKRTILFNNTGNEVTLEVIAKKSVPYYIRKKITNGMNPYFQKRRDGRCFCYTIIGDDYYSYELNADDNNIDGYWQTTKKLVSSYIKRKLAERTTYIRRSEGEIFIYKMIENEIYVANVTMTSDGAEDIYSLMNQKEIYSRLSGKRVVFVRCLTNEHYAVKDGVFCDGINFIDNIKDVEDDISQMFCNFKEGGGCNMQDFYSMYGAYEKGNAFIKNIKKLIQDAAQTLTSINIQPSQ